MWYSKNAKHLQLLEAPTVSKHLLSQEVLTSLSLCDMHPSLLLHLSLMYGLQAQAPFLHTLSVGDGVAPALCKHLLFPITCWSPCWREGIPWVCMHIAELWVPTGCTLHCQSSSWVQARLLTASDGEDALSGTGRGCDVGRVTLGSVIQVLTTPGCLPLVKKFMLLLYFITNFTLLLYFYWILFCFESVWTSPVTV